MPILRTVPRVVAPPWGGMRLATVYGKAGAVEGRIGETWEVWRENRLVGEDRTLGEVIDLPLLVKLLDTREVLSVQVHPGDADARRLVGAPGGKAEAWVVLHAEPGARIAYGLNRAMSAEELGDRARSGAIEADLAWRPVRAGDVIDVPPGTLHAIGPGLLLYEVQQPSDITWRLYDWGRGRELHLDLALQVAIREPVVPSARPRRSAPGVTELVVGRSFLVDRIDVPARVPGLRAITVVEGSVAADGEPVRRGETVVGTDVDLTGAGEVLAAGVP